MYKKGNKMSLGFTEITLIVLVTLLLFGGKRVPELAKALGKASVEFNKAKEAIKREAEALECTNEKPQEYQIKDDNENPQV